MLGVSGAALVSKIMNVPLEVKFSTIALAIGFSTAIGVIFGVYPAKRARKKCRLSRHFEETDFFKRSCGQRRPTAPFFLFVLKKLSLDGSYPAKRYCIFIFV